MLYFRTTIGALSGIIGILWVVPCILVCLPFWGISWLTRRLAPAFDRNAVSWKEAVEFDESIGWRPKPNLDVICDCNGYREYHVKTDSQGFRGQGTIGESDVVIFGDSFAFAQGIDDGKAFFGAAQSNLRIKSIGCPGYDMVQEILLMKKLATELKGKLVVWFICFGNDLYDNLLPNFEHYRKPFVRKNANSGLWEIANSHVNLKRWPYNIASHVREKEKYVGCFGKNFHSDRIYEACEFLVKQGRDICQEVGAKFALLSIPMGSQMWSPKIWRKWVGRFGDPQEFDCQLPDRKFTEICLKLNVPLVSAQKHLGRRHLIPLDGHWNEKGNIEIANLLQTLFYQFGLQQEEESSCFAEKKRHKSSLLDFPQVLTKRGDQL